MLYLLLSFHRFTAAHATFDAPRSLLILAILPENFLLYLKNFLSFHLPPILLMQQQASSPTQFQYYSYTGIKQRGHMDRIFILFFVFSPRGMTLRVKSRWRHHVLIKCTWAKDSREKHADFFVAHYATCFYSLEYYRVSKLAQLWTLTLLNYVNMCFLQLHTTFKHHHIISIHFPLSFFVYIEVRGCGSFFQCGKFFLTRFFPSPQTYV